jgi:hypothetical protein
MPKQELDELVRKIKDWCTDEGIFKNKVPDDNANFHFILNFPPNIPHTIDLIQPKGKEDLIVIVCSTLISPEHLEKIKGLSIKDRMDFLWELKFLLGNRPTQFSMHHPDGILQNLQIVAHIYFDGLTKDRFMKVLGDVYASKLLAVWKIQQKFGSKETESGRTTYEIQGYR